MTDVVQVALIAAIPPTVVAIGGIVVALLVDRRANGKIDHITVLTNSTLTEANKRIEQLEGQVKALVVERDEGAERNPSNE